ncbi:Heme d1 biosynthesis protein NirG [hydrothermal vent metagenome]|uniref:siroheme decarboxylase n=1 Tax=hydrothermal vent metagenome TaxID=652676 RepID=A0A3B1BI58_9ZZZZ
MKMKLDELDRQIINQLQTGFPVCDQPYAEAAAALGTDEASLLARLQRLLEQRVLSRFGPLYRADRLGGAFSLAAMKVPDDVFESVADIVNSFPEVAHNYRREHAFNMWFVLATESEQRVAEVNREIEKSCGLPVYNMPKLKEYFIHLELKVEDTENA